jgi:hypothetical protein
MSDPSPPLADDPDIQPDEEQDPEAPLLTELDSPEPEPGTDIVPPDPSERREGVVCDPDTVPRPASA